MSGVTPQSKFADENERQANEPQLINGTPYAAWLHDTLSHDMRI